MFGQGRQADSGGPAEPLLNHEPRPPSGPPRRLSSSISEVFRSAATAQPRLTESLDYEQVQNQVSMQNENARRNSAKRHFYGYTGRTFGKFIVTILTGLATGVVAVILSHSTELLHGWKNRVLMEPYVGSSIVHAWALHVCYSCSLVLAAGALVQYWCPSAAGAGVAPVMAYLNGSFIPNLLNMRTFTTKLLGTICGCSANIAIGPEGPMVHMGACLANLISEANCNTLGIFSCCTSRRRTGVIGDPETTNRCSLCQSFDDTDHREFVSAGTACGLAAAFGAPIGGVLFSMEEACSYWSRKVAWRCFLAAMLSAFVISQLNANDEAGMLCFDAASVKMTNRAWLWQIPLVTACALLTGFIGACFNLLRGLVSRIRVNKRSHVLRLAEVVGLAVITITLMFAISSTAGSCVKPPTEDNSNSPRPFPPAMYYLSLGHMSKERFSEEQEYGIRWTCSPGEYNDLATLFFSSPDATIKQLFSMRRELHETAVPHPRDIVDPAFWVCGVGNGNSCKYTTRSLAIFAFTYLILMSISTGICLPAGMFMPSIMVGSASGAMFGIILQQTVPRHWVDLYPGVYALVGATSVLGGVFRASISLVIIMVEGTRGIEFLFGVIVAVVVSNWIADHIHHNGVYESELEQDGNINFLRLEPPRKLRSLLAREIMASPVIGLRPVESVSVICQVLRCCTHNGFPVFASNEEGVTDRRVTGLVLRSQLLVLLRRGHLQNARGELIKQVTDINKENVAINREMRHFYNHGNPRSFDPMKMDAIAQEVTSGASQTDIRDLYVNLRPFMNQAVITVREETSAARCHEIFIALCLRHLCVVDAGNRLVGIITRKDLDHHAGKGTWRLTKPPSMPSDEAHSQEEALARLAGHPGRGPVLGRAYPSSNQLYRSISQHNRPPPFPVSSTPPPTLGSTPDT